MPLSGAGHVCVEVMIEKNIGSAAFGRPTPRCVAPVFWPDWISGHACAAVACYS
jgi:hypothetical protein